MSTDAIAQPEGPRPAAETVEQKLRRAWRKEIRYHCGDGLAHLLVWALSLILIDLLVDWLFLIPGYGRMLLLAVNLVALGWVAYYYWLRFLTRFDPVRVALQVERQHPELESRLVSYVQLTGDAPETAHASPSLVPRSCCASSYSSHSTASTGRATSESSSAE